MCSLCSKGILWCLAPTHWHWVFSFCVLGGAFGLELFQHAVLQTTSVRFRGWVDALIWPCCPGGIPEQFMQFGTQLYPAAIRKCLEKEVQCCSCVHVTC